MKKYLLLVFILSATILHSQNIAVTEDGRKVLLKSDGTYEFVLGSSTAKSKLKGVVTYYFNSNYGFKPDVGAEVLIRKTNKSDETRLIIHNFYIATNYRKVVSNSKITNIKDEYSENKLIELGADTDEGYKKICSLATQHVFKYKLIDKEAIKLSVNGNGTFETELEPGYYEVIVISKNRTSLNSVEVLGKVMNLSLIHI